MPRPHPCLAPPPAPIAPHHLSTAPLPPAPIGLASSASRPSRAVARIASTPLRAAIRIPLCRHRADSALIAPPITTIVRRRRLTRVALRRPHRAHRAPTSASPPISLLALRRPRALAGKNRAVCIPFSPNARKRPPSWQHPPEMHVFRDQDGNILAPCIHFRAQSGDSGYMARESCRQGPFSASRSPKSRMARRCCQRRPAFPRQQPAVRPNGLCALLSRFAVRDPPRGPRTDASRYLRAAPIPPAARTHRVQETSGTTQTTQCGHKNRIPKWDPIEEFFGFAQRLPDALQPLHQANELALSYLDHSTRQRLGGYVIGLSGNSFTVDLYAALVDHATSIAR